MGLISNALPTTKLKPFNPDKQFTEANSFGYDPKLSTVNIGTDTVSGQLDSIVNEKNTGTANMIRRARENATAAVTEGMNARGLTNSSMNLVGGTGGTVKAKFGAAAYDAINNMKANLSALLLSLADLVQGG